MKKLKFLCLALVLVFVLPICFTACKKNNGPKPITANDLKSYGTDYANFVLGVFEITKEDSDYAELKQGLSQEFNSKLEKVPADVLDSFVKDVLAPSGITNDFVKGYFKLCTNYYASYDAVSKKLAELNSKYENVSNESIKVEISNQAENYESIKEDLEYYLEEYGEDYKLEYLNLMGQTLLTTPLSGGVTSSQILAAVASLELAGFSTDMKSDSEDLYRELKNYYNVCKEIELFSYDVIDASLKIALNLAIAEDTQQKIIDSIFDGEQEGIAQLQTTLTDLGINDKEGAKAYYNVLSVNLTQNKKFYSSLKTSLNFDFLVKCVKDVIKLNRENLNQLLEYYLGVNSYMPNQEDLMADIGLVMFSTILQEDFTKIINSYGNALTASFMDDASRKTFVDSAKYVDSLGVGSLAEKYVDLYRYGYNFIGEICKSVTAQDVKEMISALIVSYGVETSNASQAQGIALVSKLTADKVMLVYNGYKYKNQLKNSFSDDIQFDSIISNVNGIKNAINKNDISKAGALDCSKITLDSIETIDEKFASIQLAVATWATSNSKKIESGLEKVEEVYGPIFEMFDISDYIMF